MPPREGARLFGDTRYCCWRASRVCRQDDVLVVVFNGRRQYSTLPDMYATNNLSALTETHRETVGRAGDHTGLAASLFPRCGGKDLSRQANIGNPNHRPWLHSLLSTSVKSSAASSWENINIPSMKSSATSKSNRNHQPLFVDGALCVAHTFLETQRTE